MIRDSVRRGLQIAVAILVLGCSVDRSLRDTEEKISPELREILLAAGPERQVPVLVFWREQPDFVDIAARTAAEPSKRVRRDMATKALRDLSDRSRERIAPLIGKLTRRGLISNYKHWSVVNGFRLNATSRAVREIARESEIDRVIEQSEEEALGLATLHQEAAAAADCWAAKAIGADVLRQRGIDGRGVTVGIIDSGVLATHEQLRGGIPEAGSFFFDPSDPQSPPHETALTGHGTGLLSVAVGRPAGGVACGIAPGAQWIAAVGLPRGHYNNLTVLDAADWIVNIAQPDVLILAWVTGVPRCDPTLRSVLDALAAAEIQPVVAAGNFGDAPSSDRAPGNLVGLHAASGRAFSVGAIGRDGSMLKLSSRGPNSCDGGLFPMISAPGEDILAALPLRSDVYVRTRGTSVAAAVAAGACALLMQEFPDAPVSLVERALIESAADLGAPGPDNDSGYGQISVDRAMRRLSELVACLP